MSTEYVILVNTDDKGPRWQEVGKYQGRSSGSAIRAFLARPDANLLHEDSGGVYVAVPARSWQPVKVAVETALKFS